MIPVRLVAELRQRGVRLAVSEMKLAVTSDTPLDEVAAALLTSHRDNLLSFLRRFPFVPEIEAGHLLTDIRCHHGPQTAEAWLQHFDKAHAAAVATFPSDRQSCALIGYRARYCEGQVAQVIAVHTLALLLWAADDRVRPFGVMLEAACEACGLDSASLPREKQF